MDINNKKLNILYISKLSGNLYAGPNHSVPAQVKAQSKYDNVLWYNINNVKRPEWSVDGLDCKNLDDFPSGRLKDLPEPFNRPDMAVVEEFYCYPFCRIIEDLIKEKIPFVIVPRSEMTKQAQAKSSTKKLIGNALYFKRMAKKAAAIQYLTDQEYIDSGDKWNRDYYIISNGTDAKENIKDKYSEDSIEAVYIGRYEMYQKGLDILFEAIARIKEDLRQNHFMLKMYGVDQENTVNELKKMMAEYKIEDLIEINDSVFGEEKERVLLKSDVFVMTSRFEGMPMGMIEALSYGLPCIASKGTNLSDVIKEYDAGWVTDDSVDSVVDGLKTMIAEKNAFDEKGRNAIALANNYTWDSLAQKSHEIFAGLIR